jgi:two-component system LytT family sensor kinase
VSAERTSGQIWSRTAAIVVFAWVVAGSLLAGQAWVSGSLHAGSAEFVSGRRALTIWLTWAALGALLTPIALALVARWPLERGNLRRSLALHAAASLGLALLHLALFAVLAPSIGATSAGPTWWATFTRLLRTALLLDLPAFWMVWLVAAAVRARRWAAAAREREGRELRLEAELAAARLEALRSQLEPHFLFNALNTVAILMREDVDAAERVLLSLSALLRRALEAANEREVPLRDEVSFLEAYLAIERTRFGERLRSSIEVEPQLMDARVPVLVLQPLVENAVRHGLADRVDGEIRVTAARHGDRLRLTVSDNGRGLDAPPAERIGLANTRSRLELLYGEGQSVELSTPGHGGFSVTLSIPFRVAAAA